MAEAQTIVWEEGMKQKEIGDQIFILEDPLGNFTFEEVSSNAFQSQFQPSKSVNLALGYTEAAFWVRLPIANKSTSPIILELAQAGVLDCALYYKTDTDELIVEKAGSNTLFKNRPIKNSFQVFRLSPGIRDYYIRLTTNSSPIPVRLYSQPVYEEKSISLKFVYGIYIGLMLFVFLNNLFLFFSFKNFLYLVNSFNIIIFLCYSMVVVDGFVVYFFQKIDLLFWFLLIPPIGVTMQTIYTLWFLEVWQYRPRLFKWVVGLVAIYLTWLVIKFFLPFSIVQPINTFQALLSFFVIGFIGISVGRKGNRFGYYFALTYFIYFLMVLAEATYVNTGKPAYLLGLSYSGYAAIIEAIALSFLLVKKLEWEKKEIEEKEKEAQLRLVTQTLENERIVKEQNLILENKVRERTLELSDAKEKSDNLLKNILPDAIAEELKASGKAKARIYNSVTVLFSDFKDFTTISSDLGPEELVREIDVCFSAFDEIMKKYAVEKIKTVGDAYIAAAGLPKADPLHAENVALAALEIRDFISNRKKEKIQKGETYFELRIGIHTGPVVAGIVGVNKFAYDIWGNTVNIAARMEENCHPGKINISKATYQLVSHKFQCHHRGKINAKNKGMVDMYFLEERLK